jgi:hypothetical protein
MTPNEFILWMQGFTEAAHSYNITPKQWDDVKDKLSSVIVDETIKGSRYGLDNSNWKISNPIVQLIYKYSNDAELGKEIRKLYT